MMTTRQLAWGLAALILGLPVHGRAQVAIKELVRDGAPVQAMTPAKLNQLADPLFLLVLKNQPQETNLDRIEALLVGPTGQRHLFVVHEGIQDPARGGGRRAVLAFSGVNGTVKLDPNVMLSLGFTDQGIAPGFIEAWGWDDRRSRYNYYKLDRQPGETGPTWKFRGASTGADRLTPAQRQGTCMACHINGAPIMKELPFPWNNWHSFRSLIAYLSPTSPEHWPIAETPRFRDLKGAQDLETAFLLPAIRQFNGRRVTALIRQNAAGQPVTFPGGMQEVTDGPRLLRALFQTTEYNIVSAGQLSGLHPLPAAGTGPTEPVVAPDTFFLNANLLAGGGFAQSEGLGIGEARQFARLLQLQPAEYRAVVERFRTRLGDRPGDTHFAWFVPEASHVDNALVDILIRRGVITREFAAAVLAIDVETPVFSTARESLLKFVPPQFRFKPKAPEDVPVAHPDELTKAVITRVQAANPVAGSPEAQFLTLLQSPTPVEALRQTVSAYLGRVRGQLADAAQREAEITRLYQVMLDRRRAAIAHNPTLVESPELFPMGQAP